MIAGAVFCFEAGRCADRRFYQSVFVSLSDRSDVYATPVLSLKLHREAPVGAADPVTAFPTDFFASTQEGG